MSELGKRVFFALPAGALFLWLTWLGGIPFMVLVGVITVVSFLEMNRLFSKIHPGVWIWLAVPIALLIWLIPLLPVGILVLLLAGLLIATAAAWLSSNCELSRKWLATLFCGIYVPTGLLFFLLLRSLGHADAGFWFTLALLLMIWGNDSFAYFGGRKWGKRPLAPAISPNKTWEGFWCGFAGALTGLLLIWWIADPFPIGLIEALPLVIIVSLLGPAGDLIESRIKRLAGQKDSSNLLPGHGGMLDRFDAFILAAPGVVLYLSLLV